MKRVVWITFGIGMWLLVFAPFALMVVPLRFPATANHAAVGIVLIGLSLWILSAPAPPVAAAWCVAACGLWLGISPFVLRFTSFGLATAHDIVVGLATLATGAVAAAALARRAAAA
jgi:hypothetical protein